MMRHNENRPTYQGMGVKPMSMVKPINCNFKY